MYDILFSLIAEIESIMVRKEDKKYVSIYTPNGLRTIPIEDAVVEETAKVGSGYDLQEAAFARLGEGIRNKFNSCRTGNCLYDFAEEYKDQLTPEEYKEFIGYASFIGALFGYGD